METVPNNGNIDGETCNAVRGSVVVTRSASHAVDLDISC